MDKTMKVAVVQEFGKPLVIEQVPIPTPGPGEVLIKIVAMGDWPVKPNMPFIPGHEGTGVVAELGAGVTDLKIGDKVGTAWLHDACRNCEYCETGWETLCEAQHVNGYTLNGTFAKYAIGAALFDDVTAPRRHRCAKVGLQ
ncbi:MAG: alcohol dehydrogenase catalytic domain-containing protein [Paracoccaceae bacterium]